MEDRDTYAEAQFDDDWHAYHEEIDLYSRNPNYCGTCLEYHVIFDGQSNPSGPCPECQKNPEVVVREKSRAQQVLEQTGQEVIAKGTGFEVVYIVGESQYRRETAYQLFYSTQMEKISGWLQANGWENKNDWREPVAVGQVYIKQEEEAK